MFFKPLKKTGPFHLFIDLFSTTRPRAQKELIISLLTNNPSYGLLNAWSELEHEVKTTTKSSWLKSTSEQIISECERSLSLAKSEVTRLQSLSRTRNGVAHALDDRKSPKWGDVIFVLRITKKYRKLKK
jgi:hypothetical protein